MRLACGGVCVAVDAGQRHIGIGSCLEPFRFEVFGPHATGDAIPANKDDMVAVDVNGANGASANGASTSNGVKKRGTYRDPNAHLKREATNPYAARASDLLSNLSNFNIIESTLRGLSCLSCLIHRC